MNIVIIGAGKIGATLTEQLLREGHEITVVDTRTAALDAIGNTLDVMTVEGNGISMDTQVEAGVPSADLVIAVMSTDEQNLLSCLIAKRLGVGNTIARVRNPEYTSGLHLIQDDLGLSMALNPELASATEIARILRAPASIKIDTFSKGRVELHKMRIDPGSILDGMKLSDLGRLQSGALVCVVERGQHEVYIPDGSFTLLAGDRISVVASPKLAAKFAVASSTPSAFDCVSMFMGKAPALVRDTNAKDSTGNAFFRYVTGFTRFAARIIRCTMNIAMIATYEKIMNLPRSTIAAKSLVAMTFAMSAMTP